MPKKNQDLPGVEGEGVSVLEIPELDKVIAKYEKKKEARCSETPGEIAAKQELKAMLHQFKDRLPVNGEGHPFYRHDDTDYIIAEKLVRKAVPEAVDED